MTKTIRRATTLIAGSALLMTSALSTAAATGGWEPGTEKSDRFYGNFDQDVLLFAGASAEATCREEIPSVASRVRAKKNGVVVVTIAPQRVKTYLYATDLGAPEFLAETCAALGDADPATLPVQPFATGSGNLRERVEVSPDDGTAVVNSVRGHASNTAGETWRIRGWADLVVEDGIPVGDPAEFQGLTVIRTGR